ncbi:MAG: methylmalonyl-CoA mutase family protein [Actinobacteria bacterium]|nr:methylmalonyl-CoA mutase family protein [Actinomycetota bacterium]
MTLYAPSNPVRFVTAASLFDGHDAAINVMRRILQSQGAEVIHLGHDRSVAEVARAAVQEDVQGVAISSYQGGHVEYFKYLRQLLDERNAEHIRIYGGGGGVISPSEIAELAEHRVRIFSPEDGQRMGLPGMINSMIEECDFDLADMEPANPAAVRSGDEKALARAITAIENGFSWEEARVVAAPEHPDKYSDAGLPGEPVVLGITGTGGSGKSSLTDELVRRFLVDHDHKLRIAVLAVDPTRRRGGGALLGDRIRMNAIDESVYFRSLATRGSSREIPDYLPDALDAVRAAGYDLIIVETPGIGQGDTGLVDFVDVALYVMTPEFGAASQLEKIDMLDFADVVAINKFERRGAEDALRDVSRQLVRNREAFDTSWEQMPVFGTSAARFNDDGVTALYGEIRSQLREHGLSHGAEVLPVPNVRHSTGLIGVIPGDRDRYLSDVAATVRDYRRDAEVGADIAHRLQAVRTTATEIGGSPDLAAAAEELQTLLSEQQRQLLERWPQLRAEYEGTETANGETLRRETLSGTPIPRVALPRYRDDGDLLSWLSRENLPGHFPYTAGVFPFKRAEEDPTRMFAGEGDAFATNRRFHLLSEDSPATRLSTAFDSVTLYGRDPAERPDIYGKVGTSGVSIATLEDMKVLYSGFDLTDPSTSVSMTINGPAPAILAMYLNTAIDQQVDRFNQEHGRGPDDEELADLRARTLQQVRGTVQADILKEDQGQNTCLFSTEFSLRCMADVQEWFIENRVRNFYSVSISGYHIAEAGANPISQLAFTLANAFTYVEAYLARGMAINDFAPSLSFFFSNGMDAEYNVIGRVARRIWAVAMRDRYGADKRSQRLKYHVQTSGRSLHAQEMAFNDIRTTLQALIALYDECNSLHTNAYDEAVTTPTEESVRRALAIQLIISREWGLSKNENPLQGSFVIEELTDLVEEAVLAEFDRMTERGGVLGAMETGYQRGRIQDESLLYERLKHSGELPLIGVNTFRSKAAEPVKETELRRATETEKQSQLDRLREFHAVHHDTAPQALARLKETTVSGGNVFAELMNTVRVCSLGEITEAFFEVGGRYRRNV